MSVSYKRKISDFYLFAIQHQQNEKTADYESTRRGQDQGGRLEHGRVEFREYLALLQRYNPVISSSRSNAMREPRGRRVGQVAENAELLHPRQLLQVKSHVHLVWTHDLERQDYRLLADLHLYAVLQTGAQTHEEVRRLLGEQRLVLDGQEATREVQRHFHGLDWSWYWKSNVKIVGIYKKLNQTSLKWKKRLMYKPIQIFHVECFQNKLYV